MQTILRTTAFFLVLVATLGVTGCSSGTGTASTAPTGTTTPPTPTGPYVYAIQFDGNLSGVLKFAPLDTMFTQAVGDFYTQQTQGSIEYTGIAVDTSGSIYVQAGDSILVFPPDAQDLVTPIRTISGTNTRLYEAGDIAVDSMGNVYTCCSTQYEILEFAAGANGNVAPIRSIPTIAGGAVNTGLNGSNNLAVDSEGYLYVTNLVSDHTTVSASSSIAVFSPSQSGDVVPVRLIYGPNTGIYEDGIAGDLQQISGIALDASDNVYVAVETNLFGQSILEYAAGADQNAIPIRTISGLNTDFSTLELGGLCLDVSGNIYLNTYDRFDLVPKPGLVVFGATASGNVPPIASVQDVPLSYQIACH